MKYLQSKSAYAAMIKRENVAPGKNSAIFQQPLIPGE